MATNRTTTTVAVRLDLAELITQLRNLADTLETTQKPKLQDDDPGTTEPDKPTDCERCGTSYDECTKGIFGKRGHACCPSCYTRTTHNQHVLEAWNRRQPKPAELDECRHEAWDVHPNGITRHCSDCRATMADLMPEPKRVIIDEFFAAVDPELVAAATRQARRKLAHAVDSPCCAPEGIRDLNSEAAAGKLSDEALAALRRKLSGQPEPSHFTDGTKPARNPHTLDLPEGMDPAEAEHILRVTDDALKARTQPIMFFAGGTLSSHGLVATLNQPAPDLGVDSHGLRCTRCEHPYHRRSICPACGCDPRRADHGADPR